MGSDSVKRAFIEHESEKHKQAGKKEDEKTEQQSREEDLHGSISTYFHQVGGSSTKVESCVVVVIMVIMQDTNIASIFIYSKGIHSTRLFFFINLLHIFIHQYILLFKTFIKTKRSGNYKSKFRIFPETLYI